ncbi:hypothetical protein BC941DRAFT_476695 [Chlamydoabsidia padenii]|nr:hypothetical protein BC941DRAFT_476695 [Chlamydoabsidia padenii]
MHSSILLLLLLALLTVSTLAAPISDEDQEDEKRMTKAEERHQKAEDKRKAKSHKAAQKFWREEQKKQPKAKDVMASAERMVQTITGAMVMMTSAFPQELHNAPGKVVSKLRLLHQLQRNRIKAQLRQTFHHQPKEKKHAKKNSEDEDKSNEQANEWN